MRKHLAPVVAACVTALLIATFAVAQPLPGFSKTAPLAGTGSSGAPLKITACANGEALISNGTSWDCATAAGDITGFTAGDGMTGTTASGAISAAVGCGTGISCGADAVTLNMTAENCAAGSFLDNVSATGTFGCVAEVGDISSIIFTANGGMSSSGTTTASGAATVGLQTDCGAGPALLKWTEELGWFCSTDTDTNTTYTAGDGITLTGTDFDLDTTNDFTITGGQLDTSTTFTLGGSLTVATTAAVTGNFSTLADTTLGNSSGDVLDVNGSLSKFGNGDGAIYINEDQLNGGYDTNGTDYFIVNYNGYLGSTTQFRDFHIYNGKQAAIASFDGATKATTLAGTLNIAGLVGTVQSGACGNDTALTATTSVLVCTSGGVYGITGGTAGRILHVTSSATIDLVHEAGGSTAANRLAFPATYTTWYMYAGQTKTFIYDGASSRWRTTSEFRFPAMYVDSTLDVLTTSNLVGLVTGTAGFTTAGNYTTTGGGDVVSADKVTAIGNLEISANSQLGNETTDRTDSYGKIYVHGVEPALSGAGCSNCTISDASTDGRGIITCSDGPNVCVVTFSAAYDTNPPACSLTSTLAANHPYFTSAPTTTALTFTTQAAGAQTIHYMCDGIIGTD